jgi:hypothetical protein
VSQLADNSRVSKAVQSVPVSRRGFINRVVAGTFVAPVVSSAAIATVFGSRGLEASPQYPVSTGAYSGSGSYSSYSSSGGGSVDVIASADSFLRKESENTNEGANLRLRVGVSPISRAVVQFDPSTVANNFIGARQVQLILTIAANHDTWGQIEPRSVVAHPLKVTFVEGNGLQALMPASLAQRGTGSGVTWRSPDDPDVANRRPDPRHHAAMWNGGKFGPATAAPVPHENLQTGTVVFDVTADLANPATSGWLLKIDRERTDEDHDDDDDNRRPAGSEANYGVVEYHSVQGAQSLGDMTLAPILRFTY